MRNHLWLFGYADANQEWGIAAHQWIAKEMALLAIDLELMLVDDSWTSSYTFRRGDLHPSEVWAVRTDKRNWATIEHFAIVHRLDIDHGRSDERWWIATDPIDGAVYQIAVEDVLQTVTDQALTHAVTRKIYSGLEEAS